MKLSALNLPALVILVTSHTGGLGASIHQSEADALEDVVRELQQDNGAPDDLEPTISAISDWIGDVDLIYEFSVQPLSLPGYRVVAYDHTAGAVLDQRLADTTDLDAAQAFAGMIWNQTGFGRDDVSVFLYRIGGDEPIFTIRNDDERAETLDEAKAAWEDDPSKATAADYRTAARQYHSDGMIEDTTLEQVLAETAAYVSLNTPTVPAKVGLILRSGEPWVGDWIGADGIQTAHPSFDAAKAKNAEHGHRWYPYEAHAEEQDGKPGYRLLDKA